MSNIVITGCSSGIGFATTVRLAEKGHTVFATMRHPSDNLELQFLADKKRLPIIILPLDVTLQSSVNDTISQILDDTGKIDVLINNAGIGEIGAVEELSVENFINQMDTNYVGSVRCTKAVLPHMRQRKNGLIINISSVGGKLFSNFNAPYCASKAAVEAFSECLAMEMLPFGIRVALVEPGVIDTPLQDKCKPKINGTHYQNLERALVFFEAAREHHIPPDVVAEVILKIVRGESKKFRNTAGPDSRPFLDMRAGISDEDWIASAGMDEANWIQMMEGMHLDIRKFLNRRL